MEVIAELTEIHAVDVVILAESEIEHGTMLRRLNRDATRGYHFPVSLCPRIVIYTRFSRDFLRPTFESERISIRRLSLPARNEVILVAVHLPSKLYWSAESQPFECMQLSDRIAEQEAHAGHRRTIVVGDFNMNPFETGLVGAGGLNAVMSRRIAARGSRTVQGCDYQFFYNPMWNHLGDQRCDTAGSYYYDSAEHVNYYWNVFDQVLLRPELADGFDPNQISILRSAGMRSLIHPDGRPDDTGASDHLPILFKVEF